MTASYSERYKELMGSSDARLEELLVEGKAPDPKDLAGWEFRGWNIPWVFHLLGIKKFVKGFFEGNGLEGYNVPVRQNGAGGEWQHVPSPEAPKRFGFYLAHPVDPGSVDNKYPHTMALDYGASPRNPAWKPERVIRDYVVHPFADRNDILLGKAYLALGPGIRVPSNFFILERLRRTDWKG